MKQLIYKLLKRASRRYIARHDPYIVGITGSVGKTTCRTIITDVVQTMVPGLRVYSSPQNFNSEIGLCLSILAIPSWSQFWSPLILIKALWIGLCGQQKYDVLIAEYGLDKPGDIEYLVSIAEPHIGIFTIAGLVHAEGMGGPDEIIEEKVKMLQSAKELVLVSASSLTYLEKYLQDYDRDLLTYALHEDRAEQADIWFRNWMMIEGDDGLPMTRFTIEQGKESITTIETNLLSMVDAGYISLGVELAMIIAQRVDSPLGDTPTTVSITQKPGRMSLFAGKWGSTLLDSTYNASPQSMEFALQTAIKIRNQLYPEHNLLYALGDMRELGDFEEKSHRELARLVAQSADQVFLVGAAMHDYMADELEKIGFNMQDVHCCASSRAVAESLERVLPSLQKRSLVLFKGSQNTLFMEEAIVPLLKNKEDTQHLVRQSSPWRGKKKRFFGSLCLMLVPMMLLGCTTTGQTDATAIMSKDQVCIQQTCYQVERAVTQQERSQGLMHRTSLGSDRGMLFVFEYPRNYQFWMKNTLIALDMIRIDADQTIVHIEQDVQPCELPPEQRCPSYGPGEGTLAQYVLEVNAGESVEHGFSIGDTVKIEQ